jgi:molecular chaperone GrpE
MNSPDPTAASAAPEPAAAPAPERAALERELEQARAQAAENLDKFLRAKAETENVRRRAELDIAAAHKYALERFAGEIVAVRDSLDLARQVDLGADNREVVRKMHEGLELTLKLMDDVFAKFGISRIDPAGEKFDPARHQAISMVESDSVPANHVATVVQKGYLLNDRVLRPAMVVVARSKPGDAPGSASAAQGGTA